MADPKPTADQKKASDTAQRWIAELGVSEKWQSDWVERGKRIIRRYKNDMYRDTGASAVGLGAESRRFAILWSNVQTLGPAILARRPQPVVTRRYKDADPVGRYAAEVIERSLIFAIDQYDFEHRLVECRDDYLLVGRGQVWARYVPHVAQMGAPVDDETGEDVQITATSEGEGAADSVTYQEALCDHVAYNDFGMQPCQLWAETDYVWRRVFMNRRQLVERFGKIGRKVPLDYAPKDATQRPDDNKDVKKAAIYEIWDKPSGKVFWIHKNWPAHPLDERDDPLGLRDFFPCPRPLMATTPPDDYIPVPDYVYYQDQAEELDELTQRIGFLTDALRMVGIYDASMNVELANVFNGSQNTLIPVNSMASLADKGGLKGVIEWLPIDMVIETLKGCFETRRQILDDIYQITGLSDIIRGESDPQETATAQRLKGQWGSLRVRDRQKEIARFSRDIMRLQAEIIAKKFNVETLKAMTDVKLLTAQEKQVIGAWKALAQQSQAAGAQPPPMPQGVTPEMMQLLELPTWEDVNGLLKNDALRSFRVDIETDSTVEPDEAAQQGQFSAYVESITGLLTAAGPIIQAAPYTAPMFGEIMKQSARVFRINPQLEDVIEKVFDTAAQQPAAQPETGKPSGPSPQELQLQQGNLQLQAQKLQGEQQRTQTDASLEVADLNLRREQMMVDAQNTQREQAIKIEALRKDPKPQSVS